MTTGTSSFDSEASEVSIVTLPLMSPSGNSLNFKITSKFFPPSFGATRTLMPLMLASALLIVTGFSATDFNSIVRVSDSGG